jgi:3-hydroxyacyl-CoA dehydrogenase / 3-hydroxy-2-methylbutyryl-CoA dehydrogenase
MQLSGRTVLVTGGASGLGGATVDAVIAAGGRAVVLDLNDAAGGAKERAHNGSALFVNGDVTREEDVQRAIDVAVNEWGGLHGLQCRRH